MIRIIEPGTIKIKKCENCGCLFYNTYFNFGVFGDYEYVICPQC